MASKKHNNAQSSRNHNKILVWFKSCFFRQFNMSEDKVYVSFTCQRCSQSLKLDDSLHSFSEHISAELNRKLLKFVFYAILPLFPPFQSPYIPVPTWTWSPRPPVLITMCLPADCLIPGMAPVVLCSSLIKMKWIFWVKLLRWVSLSN